MKKGEFEREWKRRLKENRQLLEHQYLPERMFFLAAFVGQHLFWVVLTMSFLLALLTTRIFPAQLKVIHTIMLFI